MPCHTAQFAKAKTERRPYWCCCRMFVEASGESNRVRKAQAEHCDRQSGSSPKCRKRLTQRLTAAHPAETAQSPIMNLLRLLREKNGSEKGPVKPAHATEPRRRRGIGEVFVGLEAW